MSEQKTRYASKAELGIESLLVWTFATQRADLVRVGLNRSEIEMDGGTFLQSSSDGVAAMMNFGRLGTRIDCAGSVGRSSINDVHPDADHVAASVQALGERESRLIVDCARNRQRPDWCPRGIEMAPVNGTDENGVAVPSSVPEWVLRQQGLEVIGEGAIKAPRGDGNPPRRRRR